MFLRKAGFFSALAGIIFILLLLPAAAGNPPLTHFPSGSSSGAEPAIVIQPKKFKVVFYDLCVTGVWVDINCRLGFSLRNNSGRKLTPAQHGLITVLIRKGIKTHSIPLSKIDPTGKLKRPKGKIKYTSGVKLNSGAKVSVTIDSAKKIPDKSRGNNTAFLKGALPKHCKVDRPPAPLTRPPSITGGTAPSAPPAPSGMTTLQSPILTTPLTVKPLLKLSRVYLKDNCIAFDIKNVSGKRLGSAQLGPALLEVRAGGRVKRIVLSRLDPGFIKLRPIQGTLAVTTTMSIIKSTFVEAGIKGIAADNPPKVVLIPSLAKAAASSDKKGGNAPEYKPVNNPKLRGAPKLPGPEDEKEDDEPSLAEQMQAIRENMGMDLRKPNHNWHYIIGMEIQTILTFTRPVPNAEYIYTLLKGDTPVHTYTIPARAGVETLMGNYNDYLPIPRDLEPGNDYRMQARMGWRRSTSEYFSIGHVTAEEGGGRGGYYLKVTSPTEHNNFIAGHQELSVQWNAYRMEESQEGAAWRLELLSEDDSVVAEIRLAQNQPASRVITPESGDPTPYHRFEYTWNVGEAMTFSGAYRVRVSRGGQSAYSHHNFLVRDRYLVWPHTDTGRVFDLAQEVSLRWGLRDRDADPERVRVALVDSSGREVQCLFESIDTDTDFRWKVGWTTNGDISERHPLENPATGARMKIKVMKTDNHAIFTHSAGFRIQRPFVWNVRARENTVGDRVNITWEADGVAPEATFRIWGVNFVDNIGRDCVLAEGISSSSRRYTWRYGNYVSPPERSTTPEDRAGRVYNCRGRPEKVIVSVAGLYYGFFYSDNNAADWIR